MKPSLSVCAWIQYVKINTKVTREGEDVRKTETVPQKDDDTEKSKSESHVQELAGSTAEHGAVLCDTLGLDPVADGTTGSEVTCI